MLSLKQILLPFFFIVIVIIYSGCDGDDETAKTCALSKLFIRDNSTLNFEFDDKKRVSKIHWVDGHFSPLKTRIVKYGANGKLSSLMDLSVNEDTMLKVTFSYAAEKTYIDLVSEATSRIPVHEAEWTDYNTHDPGITILEAIDYSIQDLRHRQVIRLDCLTSTTSYTKYYSPNYPEGVVEQVAKYHFDSSENPYYNKFFLYPEMRELIFFKKNVLKATYTSPDGNTLPKSFSTEIKNLRNNLPTTVEKRYFDGRVEMQELEYECNE